MDLTIDHVIPRAEGGPTSLSNSALACLWCNAHKWKSTKALDPRTGRWVRLFHPRRDRWEDHFKWAPEDLARIEGRTATGRATVDLLEMNSGRALAIRRWLMRIGLHPP
ncbi:MAG: HNH endonuclease [Planctomycetes bacterium]|nr:HNH endonuclease [Planctomycetota bacterium]